jgi:hypothetical protein
MELILVLGLWAFGIAVAIAFAVCDTLHQQRIINRARKASKETKR